MLLDPTAPFYGPSLKLKRAKHHIEDFIAKAEKFYSVSNTKFYIEDNPQTRKRALCVDVDETVPEEFPLIIGDAVHNLRSALDHMTWDIVSPLGPERPNDVQFPFCRKAEGFESALAHRQITLAGEQAAERFRELKPYPGGNDLIYALHQLDIADKHQLILPVRSLIGFDRFKISDVDPSAPADLIIEMTAFTNLAKDNRIAEWRYHTIDPPPVPRTSHKIDMTVQIMFREGQPLAGKSVSASLRSLAIMIDGAIDAFTP